MSTQLGECRVLVTRHVIGEIERVQAVNTEQQDMANLAAMAEGVRFAGGGTDSSRDGETGSQENERLEHDNFPNNACGCRRGVVDLSSTKLAAARYRNV